MKRHVEEIASDARTLEEKLNSFSDQFELETIVWANGKLLVVVRESSHCQAAIQSSQDQNPLHTKTQSSGNSKHRLPEAGARIRKAKLIQ